ncbi:hypothetical protein [Nitrosomonas sp.]|uniref:hypothetical protein n=1 Tax=Nitrosomonas sp. TaxID=42353 RepID=UPI0020893671|nr:hypothetical protein [Nitrosomonas sp.]GJL76900.1 MAG: hypothetical protein NMNS02_30060 [Nitrosomonas sp.]
MSEQHNFLNIVAQHFVRYPWMQPQDLYKLTHQASFGSGHLVEDKARAADSLRQEIAGLAHTSKVAESVVETIAPKARLVRVYLRPYLMNRGNPAELLDAFVRTANEYRGSFELFQADWEVVQVMAQRGMFPFSLEETNTPMRQAIEIMQTHQLPEYPPFSHSEVYRSHYDPAYRVVAFDFLPASLATAVDR